MRFTRCPGTVFLNLPWEVCICFFNHVARKSCTPTILLHSVQGYQARKFHPTRPKDISRNIFCWISKELDIPMDNYDNKPLDSKLTGSVRPDMKQYYLLAMRLVSIARFQIESAALRLGVKPGLFMDYKDFSSGYQESTQGQWTFSSGLVFWIWTFHMRMVFRQDFTRPMEFRLDFLLLLYRLAVLDIKVASGLMACNPI